ncbi:hypothetical protein JW848_03185 [Candidatus Bipolaricaulota bacterium]|nr:hypothetical protein [Candidatus Bipolaricaulota bacterium]
MRRRMRILGVVAMVFSIGLCAAAQAVNLDVYAAGDKAVALIHSTLDTPVTGLHIEFDREVTVSNKVEIGGFLPLLSPSTGTAFDFAGGALSEYGTVILEWEPAEAGPYLIQWISGAAPVGEPYIVLEAYMASLSLPEFGLLLAEGIVAAREQDPLALQAAFDQFFAANALYFAGLEASLGMPLADSLMPVIISSPAEGIVNFFVTLVGMLGVDSVGSLMQGDVNFMPLLALVQI